MKHRKYFFFFRGSESNDPWNPLKRYRDHYHYLNRVVSFREREKYYTPSTECNDGATSLCILYWYYRCALSLVAISWVIRRTFTVAELNSNINIINIQRIARQRVQTDTVLDYIYLYRCIFRVARNTVEHVQADTKSLGVGTVHETIFEILIDHRVAKIVLSCSFIPRLAQQCAQIFRGSRDGFRLFNRLSVTVIRLSNHSDTHCTNTTITKRSLQLSESTYVYVYI